MIYQYINYQYLVLFNKQTLQQIKIDENNLVAGCFPEETIENCPG